ncbi:hypothetical protein OG936_10630 [Streptomyces sp. NBC_00846]|uniref:hypothetical protein n=1 Tax=Streptomyces sp. NBC_00846 TaxID=2975849 RepID=UPI0038670C09|nr:hypothetical protein OG936_10630 [Streptomyces sp. NBC_00846]
MTTSLDAAVLMDVPAYPDSGVLLARLVRSQENGLPRDTGLPVGKLSPIPAGQPPTEEFLHRLAERLGVQSHDLFLVAGLAIPDDALLFDEEAGRELPQLVQRALRLPASDRQRLRDFAQSLAEVSPQSVPPKRQRPYEQYPPGFGSLLVRMLALRNLGWSSAAKVMYLMSGVYLSAATIGAVGRGVKELDAELLNGFAVVLGIPVAVLASLTGVHQTAGRRGSPENVDTAALLWEVRHLTAAQVREVSHLADFLGRR